MKALGRTQEAFSYVIPHQSIKRFMNKKSKALSRDSRKNHFSSFFWFFSFCCLNLWSWSTSLKQFTFSLLCSSDTGHSNLACCAYSIPWLRYNTGHKQLICYLLVWQMKSQNYTPKSKPDFSFILPTQDKENVSFICLNNLQFFFAVQFFIYFLVHFLFELSTANCMSDFSVQGYECITGFLCFQNLQWTGRASVTIKWMLSLGLKASKKNKGREQ